MSIRNNSLSSVYNSIKIRYRSPSSGEGVALILVQHLFCIHFVYLISLALRYHLLRKSALSGPPLCVIVTE